MGIYQVFGLNLLFDIHYSPFILCYLNLVENFIQAFLCLNFWSYVQSFHIRLFFNKKLHFDHIIYYICIIYILYIILFFKQSTNELRLNLDCLFIMIVK